MKITKALWIQQKGRPLFRMSVLLILAISTGLLLGTAAGPTSLMALSESVSPQLAASGPGQFWNSQTNNRLIVELSSPSLAEAYTLSGNLEPEVTYFNSVSPDLQSYALFLQNEHEAFNLSLPEGLPIRISRSAPKVTGPVDELAFDLIKNAVILEFGEELSPVQIQSLESLPQVKYVHSDLPVFSQLYAGPSLINVGSQWQNTPGGRAHAGKGVLIASIDGGLHKDAPMFSGDGFEFPAWMPKEGLGIHRANNGKIVVSRTYFRDWDPPVASDYLPWPGSGTSHGVHTGAIAGGNIVTGAFWDGMALDPISGVAPGAWMGNYRVLYKSKQSTNSFFTVEGVMALEDAVVDGADVMVGAWGIGPSTASAPNDFLDSALINTTRAGVYVVMAAGNYGPLPFSVSNPSDEYLTVGAVSTTGFLWDGRLDITESADSDSLLARIQYAPARFGPEFPQDSETSYQLVSGRALNADNVHGCQSWSSGSLDDRMLVVSRGLCTFAEKIAHAHEAGAAAVVVYNHPMGRDQLLEMVKGPAEFNTPVPSLFVGHSSGQQLEALAAHSPSYLLAIVSTVPEQMGNQPFVVPNFSGRGPTFYGGLKPDVVAPGVHILSQGFGTGTLDRERHMGYGQETGTSMAAPFVAGAAALLMEQHPNWTAEMITSALMSTAQYEGIYTSDGSLAQPTDMGSGLVDIERALNPGAFLVPSKISFGRVRSLKGLRTQQIEIFNAGETPLSLELSVEKLLNSGRESLDSFKIEPQAITLPPRGSSKITVSLEPDPEKAQHGYVQGFLVLRGGIQELHAPLFAWLDLPGPSPEILLLDADLSPMQPDYSPWYTAALDELEISYGYWNAAQMELKVPSYVSSIDPPKVVVIFTGDGKKPLQLADGIPLPFTPQDQELLVNYVKQGGSLLVMGRDAASFFTSAPLQTYLLGTAVPHHSPELSNGSSSLMVHSNAEIPHLLQGLQLDLRVLPGLLESVELVPQLDLPTHDLASSEVKAIGTFVLSPLGGTLECALSVEVPQGTAISDAWFYIMEEDSKTRVKDLLSGPHVLQVFGTWHWKGQLDLNEDLENARKKGDLHVAVQLSGTSTVTLVGQVSTLPVLPLKDSSVGPIYSLTSGPVSKGQVPFMKYVAHDYSGPDLAAIASDLSLDPAYSKAHGKTAFVSFGLEQVKETDTTATRAEFLKQVLAFLAEETPLQE